MCLMLYIGSREEIPLSNTESLCVEALDPEYDEVRQWFSLPHVRYVGAHTGCSCGFPSVVANPPIEWYDGLLKETREDRPKDLQSVRELLALIAATPGDVELFPAWAGDEFDAPDGTIELRMDALTPERFFFNQHFLYRVVK